MKKFIVSKSRLVVVSALLFTILSISNSCTKSSAYNMPPASNTGSKGSSGPGANEVWIQGMAFDPASITVTTGTSITWTNKDGIGHTVTSDAGLFDSGTINTNGTFSYMFATAGTFTYHCKIHSTMTGSVIVKAPSMGY
jgi:plastocyanin